MLFFLFLSAAVVVAAQGGPPPGIPTTAASTTPQSGPDVLSPPGADLDANRAPGLLAASIIGTLLAAGFVGLRIWRTIEIKKFRGDDHLIAFSMFFHLATTITIFVSVGYGEGKHVAAIPEDHRLTALRLTIITQCIGAIALVLAKISVGATLLQLKLGRTFDVLVVVCLVVAAVGNFLNSIVVFGGCRTRHLFYTGRDLPCIPVQFFAASTWLRAAGNVLADTFFVVAPIWFLRKIRLTPRDRIAMHLLLSFIFTATVFAVANAITVRDSLRNGIDMTWNTAIVLCFQSAEVSFCIMAACLPSIRHMLGSRFPQRWRFWHPLSSADLRSTTSRTGPFARRHSSPGATICGLPFRKRGTAADASVGPKIDTLRSLHQDDLQVVAAYPTGGGRGKMDFPLPSPRAPSPTRLAFAKEYRRMLRSDGETGWPLRGSSEDEKAFFDGRDRDDGGSSSWSVSEGEREMASPGTGRVGLFPFASVDRRGGNGGGLAELEAQRHVVELEAQRATAELEGGPMAHEMEEQRRVVEMEEQGTGGMRTFFDGCSGKKR
ncbi:hypothetical protein CAC42_2322 [Sphaceloma murrayae]|uniref:Rhodopsin domain-containing protein n=1 Tax=Sphaceloma murrayae TaxID=2082308 RepID=A0A2K1QJR4_9PEZI|nr:hypothetical protein CAC42_2322 [Sphaceloma murrayae]